MLLCQLREETNRKENKMPKKASGDFNKNKYINDYIKEKYDRINLMVPMGTKSVIKSWASAEGKSINEYVNNLITADLEKKGGTVTSAVCDPDQLPKPKDLMGVVLNRE